MNNKTENTHLAISSGSAITAIAIAAMITMTTPAQAEECLLDNGSGFGITGPNEGQAYSQGDVLLFGGNPDTDGGADGTGASSLACGENSMATEANTTALGADAEATAENGTAVGQGATASMDGATALGQDATASAVNSVALGIGSVADVADTVSVGAAGSERRITNVADGTNATDVATLGQVQAADTVIADAAAAAQSSADANTLNIATNTTNIGATTSNIAANTSNIAANTSNITSNRSNIARNSSNISFNGRNISRNKSQINVNTNDIAQTRLIVGANSTAIASNANSIDLNRQNIFTNMSGISALSADLDGFKKTSRSGIAGASAFVEPWSDGTPGATMAIGAASYDGENAMSLNFGYKPQKNQRLDLIGGVSFTSAGDDIFRVGLRYRWNSGKKSIVAFNQNNEAQMAINDGLKEQLAAQDEKLRAQAKALAELSEQLKALTDAN